MKTNEIKPKLLKDTSKKYQDYYARIGYILARLGLKNYQIYILLEISEPTGVSWYRKIPEFNLAIKDGRVNKVDFNFSPTGGEIELRERIPELLIENKRLEEQNERLKDELNIKYRPANPEHEKQMKLLNEITERSNKKEIPISKEVKTNIGLSKEWIKTDMTDIQLQRFLLTESREDKHIRWNEGKYYNLADFFISETAGDRKARYAKGIFTAEEYSDMHPGW